MTLIIAKLEVMIAFQCNGAYIRNVIFMYDKDVNNLVMRMDPTRGRSEA